MYNICTFIGWFRATNNLVLNPMIRGDFSIVVTKGERYRVNETSVTDRSPAHLYCSQLGL